MRAGRSGYEQIATPEDVLALYEGNFFERMRAAGLDDVTIAAVSRGSGVHYERAMTGIRPFPGMTDLLGELGLTHEVVIVSSNDGRIVERILRLQDIAGVAEVLGAEAGLSKVDKLGRLMERFPGQREYWFVGDTAGDMREARLAGADPVGVAWGWHDPGTLLAAGALRIAASTGELGDLIAGGA